MIRLSRLNGKAFVINCEMIKYVESTPDTIVTLSGGEKLMVRESVDDVIRLTMDYRKRLYQEAPGIAPEGREKGAWT
jgi:flagellar protein FlbD